MIIKTTAALICKSNRIWCAVQ